MTETTTTPRSHEPEDERARGLRRGVGPFGSFAAGFSILTVATAAIAMQTVLPAIWPGFQIVGGPGVSADPTTATRRTWWLQQWSALLFLTLVLLVGAAIHLRTRLRRRRLIVLDPLPMSAAGTGDD